MYNARILLIDNNTSFVDSLTKSLQSVYNSVQVAITLDDAVVYLNKTAFDVIIYHTTIDCSGGFDALKRFQSLDSHSTIIAYSESPDVNDVINILKSGVFDYLTLPFDVSKLIDSINNGIENKKSFLEIINLNKVLTENQQTIEREKEDLKRINTELQTLTNITKTMTDTLDLDKILHEIIQGIHKVFLFDRIFVSLINVEKELEEAKIATGLQASVYNQTIKELTWDINDNKSNPWMDELIREKKIVKVEKPLENDLYKNSRIVKYHPATFIKVPLIAKGYVVGSLTLDNINSLRDISDDEIMTLRVFADHAGIAIEKARLYENLKTAHEQLKDMQQKIIETERLMAINEVAVSVNHEINNPLCSISLSIELLKKELNNDDAMVIKKLKMIEKDIKRIKKITSQLTKMQNVATTAYTPEINMVDIKRSTYLKEKQ